MLSTANECMSLRWPYDLGLSEWKTNDFAKDLSRESFNSLMKGEVPGIVIDNFYDSSKINFSEKLMQKTFLRPPAINLNHGRYAGLIIWEYFDHENGIDEYFSDVKKIESYSLPEILTFHYNYVLSRLTETGRTFKTLEINNRKCWPYGVFRSHRSDTAMNPHIDFLNMSIPGGATLDIECQLGLIIHIENSISEELGVGTAVYDRAWREEDNDDEEYRKTGWSVSNNVIKDCKKKVIPYKIGSLVLFNSSKYHAMVKSSNKTISRKLSYAFLMVKLKSDENIYIYT